MNIILCVFLVVLVVVLIVFFVFVVIVVILMIDFYGYMCVGVGVFGDGSEVEW